MKMNKIAAALIAATMSSAASAHVYEMSFDGFFTMITPTGAVLSNPDAAGAAGGDSFGVRTPLTGTLSFDVDSGAGSGFVGAFNFSGTNAAAHDITMQAIGDGNGGAGSLVMGSMLFDYGPTLNIPVYLVADAAGIFGALQGGAGINSVITGGAVTSTDAPVAVSPFGPFVGTLGNIPFAMTTLDVCQDAAGVLCNAGTPNAGFPLTDDGISGVKMATPPFPNHGANFDITTLTVTAINPTHPSAVPVPAAVWLFGSGLLGLAGVARRRKAA